MLYLTCTMISCVDLAYHGVSRAKDWVSVECGTIIFIYFYLNLYTKQNAKWTAIQMIVLLDDHSQARLFSAENVKFIHSFLFFFSCSSLIIPH